MKNYGQLCLLSLIVILHGCEQQAAPASSNEPVAEVRVEDVDAFLARAESSLAEAAKETAHASWLASNFINVDSQFVEALAVERYTNLSVEFAKQAARYNGQTLDSVSMRKLALLKLDLVLPAPSDPALSKELAQIGSQLQGMYGEGKYCRKADDPSTCLSLGEMSDIMASSRDAQELADIWQGWRTISPPMRALYRRQIEISNQGGKELGYQDVGVMWRSKYDMSAQDFAADAQKQWQTIKPFYDALHCHVRAKLFDHYGGEVVDPKGPIPAHLLGNMWGQTWGNIYELVKPENADKGYDLDTLIEQSGMDEIQMVKTAEQFFVSLGFDPLPETFWQRSLFLKPKDREVVCHASAWDLDDKDDLRIKMCIKKNAEDFETIHHELGHNFYQRAYKEQPYLFRGSANDGFHEATGDTISLSVNPNYLVQIGLLDKAPGPESDLGYLMSLALEKIAFIPWGMLVDQWRWKVFSGEVSSSDYNKSWWELREQMQGLSAPVARTEADFDPGAKYHIPGNTPYTRYFLAFIQQFQFHRSLCEVSGYEGPLHRCSIYNNKVAGEKLKKMLAMGKSRPWPEAMKEITGQPDLDASAIIDYFSPLKVWLDQENKDRQCGW